MNKQTLYSSIMILVLTAAGCSGKRELSDTDKKLYSDRGKQIAASAFETLSGHLGQAMARGGVPEAVAYCNIRAYSLVDSLSTVHKAQIKRATIWTRNSKDQADPTEEAVLKEYMKAKETSRPMEPMVQLTEDGNIHFFMPIRITAPVCLNCHGKIGSDIKESDFELIKKLYPNDKATGHAEGDLRGLWHITFTKP